MGLMVSRMAPWMFAALVVSSLSRSLLVLQRQELKLIYDLFVLSIVVATYFVADLLQLSLLEYVSMLSWGMFFSYVLYFMIINHAIRSSDRKIISK